MTKAKWKKEIELQCRNLGTWKEAYTPVIDTLADTLEQRDKTWMEFKKTGGKSTVEHTNKVGATNTAKHPVLMLWMDLNKSALELWRELGLTPSSYKKIAGGENPEKESALERVLKELGG